MSSKVNRRSIVLLTSAVEVATMLKSPSEVWVTRTRHCVASCVEGAVNSSPSTSRAQASDRCGRFGTAVESSASWEHRRSTPFSSYQAM
jgi:hypothetical protein